MQVRFLHKGLKQKKGCVLENSDVESGVNNAVEFISKVWNGIEAFLDVIPPIVIGGVVVVIFILWLWHKASH